MANPCSVLVTGGGRGIGRSIALRFAREGSKVIVAARTRKEIDSVALEIETLGGEALAVTMDVTDLSSVEAALQGALGFTGGVLDVLVNNAGVFDIRPLRELSPEQWQAQLATNLTGPYHVTLRALDALERSARPHVFNISSTAGRRPFEGCTAYCATKYGLRGFGDALRLEVADAGIRVSTVYPTATDTSIFDDVPGDWDRSTMNTPEDVAEVVWRAYGAADRYDVDDLEIPPPDPARGGP